MASLTESLATFFRHRPNVWFDGRELALIGGAYAWRTRLSDLRRPPFNMTIQNRQRTVRVDGRTFVVSEYAYLPSADRLEGITAAAPFELTPDGR